MRGYIRAWPDAYVMLTVYDSLQAYNLYETEPYDRLRQWLQVNPGTPASQWYVDTLGAEASFIVNFQGNHDAEGDGVWELHLWTNQRVYYGGRVVGVVTIGSPMHELFEAAFGDFDVATRRAYIIDRDGRVRLDSAGLLEVDAGGVPTRPPVPEAEKNPGLAAVVDEHLGGLRGGIFTLGARTYDAVQLYEGYYSYASISPIIGTDWSIVVLSVDVGLLATRFRPLLFSVIFVVLAASIVGVQLLSMFIVKPALHESETARKAADASNQAKSRFMARMSHELRTPIGAIMGISEMQLRSGALTPPVEEGLSKIYGSAGILLTLINDILDISRIEADKLTLKEEQYDVAAFVAGVAQVHMVYAERNIDFALNASHDLPAKLVGDELRIRQIITNLLTNAFKYTVEGEVSLDVRWADGLIMTVSDTGIGLSRAQLAQVQQEYTRFHEKEMPLVGGTGLGLSIVNSLVVLMDAKMEITSEVGVGTTITVRIPQQRVGEENVGEKAAAALSALNLEAWHPSADVEFMPPQLSGRVLVVDDVDTNLYVAESMLEAFGLAVELVESGYEALEKIKNGETYDVIFMDYMMPGMDGITTTRRLREMGYTGPVVVVTANAQKGESDFLVDGDFNGFMPKPVDFKLLGEYLTSFLEK
jgi:signal transduction histidine kinase/CheY-like chemotaxis protein